MNVAIIGDVGGHQVTLANELERLGVDTDRATIPEHLRVVQVGDLIHRGPDSRGTVDLVDRLMTNNPGQWIQLAGNHEAQYLHPPTFIWNETVDDHTVATLRRWWNDGTMQLAAAFTTDGTVVRTRGGHHVAFGAGQLLVTHAGLTVGLWRQLGSPTDAYQVAQAVNDARHDNTHPVWRAGAMLGTAPRRDAGVVWAEASSEVHTPWLQAQVRPPFHQAHGHSSPYQHRSGRWWPQADLVRPHAHVDPQRRHVRTHTGTADDMTLWAVDPGHGRTPTVPWQALELQMHTTPSNDQV